jgi:putative component of membrane protein insertase Oxa1/YidC/SpoIIIJ protein YidD
LIIAFLGVLAPLSVLSAQDIDPWEAEDVAQEKIETSAPTWADNLLSYYRNRIASQSISRCPFYISCSHYTERAIRKHGMLIGIAYFIDRNLYREHPAMFNYYSLKERQDGVLKLDDSAFLDSD